MKRTTQKVPARKLASATPKPRKPSRAQRVAGSVEASRAPVARASATTAGSTALPGKATIRMYRQGLGDCFLVSIPRKSGAPYRILIDCGVILGTADAVTKMRKVVENVKQESGGHIDLLLATHQHWDHLSGFVQAEDLFDELHVDDVWVAWTEDPADALARQLRDERRQALTALHAAGAAMTMAGGPAATADIESLLGFFGAAGGASTEDALAKAISLARGKVRYCRPSDDPVKLDDPDIRLYVIGPPHDAKLIRKTLPSSRDPETYGLAVRTESVSSLLGQSDDDAPFDANRSIPLATARGMLFFRDHYFGPGAGAPAWRRIDSAWLDGATELALALDSATNNTSLVIAIEFPDDEVLLFVADAQVGNWLSWRDLAWKVDEREVTGPDLLARTVFYKVGHHGSHNATLRKDGLEKMRDLRTAAIPVDHDMAVRKRWGNMPLSELVAALENRASAGVVRIDQQPTHPIEGVKVDPLFFDITI
jgi:hypothetical protein